MAKGSDSRRFAVTCGMPAKQSDAVLLQGEDVCGRWYLVDGVLGKLEGRGMDSALRGERGNRGPLVRVYGVEDRRQEGKRRVVACRSIRTML